MPSEIPDHLYHILIRTDSSPKNPHNVAETLRITGTYTSLATAKAAAHNSLFDAGYEREWFKTYEARNGAADAVEDPNHKGLMVDATSPDGTRFRVSIDTTLNASRLQSELENGRITVPLYYVVQENLEYSADGGSSSSVQEASVEGVFRTYPEARAYAGKVLIAPEEGLDKSSYEEYTEAAPGEPDCGYGENVIVRATTAAGMNYLVSVRKTNALQSVRQSEAAMRMR